MTPGEASKEEDEEKSFLESISIAAWIGIGASLVVVCLVGFVLYRWWVRRRGSNRMKRQLAKKQAKQI